MMEDCCTALDIVFASRTTGVFINRLRRLVDGACEAGHDLIMQKAAGHALRLVESSDHFLGWWLPKEDVVQPLMCPWHEAQEVRLGTRWGLHD